MLGGGIIQRVVLGKMLEVSAAAVSSQSSALSGSPERSNLFGEKLEVIESGLLPAPRNPVEHRLGTAERD